VPRSSRGAGGEGEEDGGVDLMPALDQHLRGEMWGERSRGGLEVEGEGPEGEGGGEDVGVSERALCVPDGVDCGEHGDGGGGCGAEQVARDAVDGEQRGGRDDADEGAGRDGDKSGDVPPAGEQDRWQWRVSVAGCGDGDERADAEEVPRGGDVVAGFIPEVGKTQQGEVKEPDCGEEDWIEQSQRHGWPRRDCGRISMGAPTGHRAN
jgi:hypothetical protein